MRQVRARESPREDTDTRNVNDTSEHFAVLLPPSHRPQTSPMEFHSLHDSLRMTLVLRKCTSDTFVDVAISRLSRTNVRTDGRRLLSLFRASECRSPRTERYGTVRYGTREIGGGRCTGSPLFGSRKEKSRRDRGTRAFAATRRENCQPFGSRGFPRGSDLGVRLCGNHRHAGDVCRCVTDFFPP